MSLLIGLGASLVEDKLNRAWAIRTYFINYRIGPRVCANDNNTRHILMSVFRGWWGEKKTALTLWLNLNKTVYQRFHNVVLPSSNGTSQIDHLIVSRFGLFIVETKNLKGWIFGSEQQAKWTQVIYGKKFAFQNPLRQTYRQKKVLSEFLDVDEDLIHTMVYLVGSSTFKTPMPDNVGSAGLVRFIRSFTE